MRNPKHVQRDMNHCLEALARLINAGLSWNDSVVTYILGQATALKVVLEDISWLDATEAVKAHIEQATAGQQ